MPFNRGVNLTNWFQAGAARQIQFTKYTKEDFEQIQSLGCDVIRLPINLHFMTGGAPNYQIDPLFFGFLDQVVDWAEELQMHLILDNHTFDPAQNTDPNVGIILEKVWKQMAQHYKDRSEYIYYEILNEPHGISDAQWNAIQQNIVQAIRTIDTKHTIVIGPAGWNSYNNLAAMPAYDDDNLLYTFHFYDPFVFTHQGATWVDPSMAPLGDVPFPYAAGRMPSFPSSLRGSWIESAFNNYRNEGTVARVKQLIDIAVQFKQSRNVRIFCGEFGVYIPNSQNDDRVYWYEVVRKYLEEKQIAWTVWDYHGGFGLYEEGGNDLFEHDLNVPLLQALGMNVPDQTTYIPQPESKGFFIYSDYIGEGIFEASYNDGVIDFYSNDEPNNGERCLYWSGAQQYNNIGFDFKPNKDLSELVANGYALDLMVRGNQPGVAFDIRFIDTKTTDPGDHPWRIRITLDEQAVDWDSRWHHLHIPLQNFAEQGSWDNGAWYNPQGKFDWSAIDRFEIVAEQQALPDTKLWFDNIQITDLDTARVYVATPFSENPTSTAQLAFDLDLRIFPNPAADRLTIVIASNQKISYQLFNSLGQPLRQDSFTGRTELDFRQLPPGPYFLRVADSRNRGITRKILKH
jgi:endoglucanase